MSEKAINYYGESNGHVTDDVKVMTPICIGPNYLESS